MAQSMRDIKRRIGSFENTKRITKAMKLVAASKLRRAQEKALSTNMYLSKLWEMTQRLLLSSNLQHPMLKARPVKRTGYIVITSDRGLCGGYNANLLRYLAQALDERHQSRNQYELYVVGNKGNDYLARRDYPIAHLVRHLSDSPVVSDLQEVMKPLLEAYEQCHLDEVYVVYNKFINAIVQRPAIERLLPLIKEDDEASVPASSIRDLYEYEPSEETVLELLLPKYIEGVVYNALMNAKASEFAAKMTAMNSATDNATDMISKLVIQYNRARQAAITQEIAEIVGGAMAL